MINVTSHSSINIVSAKSVWIDPFNIPDCPNDADIILITHDHYDHYSTKDIAKVKKSDSILVTPVGTCDDADFQLSPGDVLNISGITVEAIPAYNIIKPFHPKHKNWLGYALTIDQTTYYICGDTDATEESKNVKCDVLLVPCGGTYTMNARDAAQLANTIAPGLAIPTHYGSVVGSSDDGIRFKELLDPSIECKLYF